VGPEKDAGGKWPQWGIEQTVLLAGELKKVGVDLVDISSGGNWATQKIPSFRVTRYAPLSLPLSLSLRERRQRVGRSAPPSLFRFYRFRLRRQPRRRTLMLQWARWA